MNHDSHDQSSALDSKWATRALRYKFCIRWRLLAMCSSDAEECVDKLERS